MILFDSKSKTKLNLDQICSNEKNVNIYLCGPTVYDRAHLGHARSSVCFDLLNRSLKALGYKVKFARNYTDIDDKILKKMAENNETLESLTEKFIQSYEADMSALNVLEPDFKPRATHFIKEMISLILELEKGGFTYTLDDGVYFDTSRDKEYFSLSKRELEDTQSRLNNEANKKNESDFVLWKFDDKFFDAPFGRGRPGWHSECVAMIRAIFKNELCIHAGGIDLLFPHHENEAAQCRCANKHDLAKVWLHNGFVKINNEKMSKSLNNSFFISDALRDFSGEALRLYLLSVHYRAHFNYSLDDLKLSKKRLDKLYRLKKRLNLSEVKDFGSDENYDFKGEIISEITNALSDDLNISKALSHFDEFIANANLSLDKEPKNKALKDSLSLEFRQISQIFGLGLLDAVSYFQQGVSEEKKLEIESLIKQRDKAKKEKDYQKADELRELLKAQDIELLDTPLGTIWERV